MWVLNAAGKIRAVLFSLSVHSRVCCRDVIYAWQLLIVFLEHRNKSHRVSIWGCCCLCLSGSQQSPPPGLEAAIEHVVDVVVEEHSPTTCSSPSSLLPSFCCSSPNATVWGVSLSIVTTLVLYLSRCTRRLSLLSERSHLLLLRISKQSSPKEAHTKQAIAEGPPRTVFFAKLSPPSNRSMRWFSSNDFSRQKPSLAPAFHSTEFPISHQRRLSLFRRSLDIFNRQNPPIVTLLKSWPALRNGREGAELLKDHSRSRTTD